MSDFIIPEVINLIDDINEGVYAGSGAFNAPPGNGLIPPSTPPGGTGGGDVPLCWVNWQCRWTGHNNGGHSVCHVSARHEGNHSGNRLVMNFVTNFPVKDVKNASGCAISNVSSYSFTLTWNNFFNPNENIGFNFEIVTAGGFVLYDESGKPLHGAIGINNADAYYCKVVSFECS